MIAALIQPKPLTVRQERVLAFVRRYWREHGFSPSLREIQAGIDKNAATGGGIVYTLGTLEDRGLLRLERGRTGRLRAIVPIGDECHCCGTPA